MNIEWNSELNMKISYTKEVNPDKRNKQLMARLNAGTNITGGTGAKIRLVVPADTDQMIFDADSLMEACKKAIKLKDI